MGLEFSKNHLPSVAIIAQKWRRGKKGDEPMTHTVIVDPSPPPAKALAQLLGITQKELLEAIRQKADERRQTKCKT